MDGPILPKNPVNKANSGFGAIRTFQQDLARAEGKTSPNSIPQNNPAKSISEPKEILGVSDIPTSIATEETLPPIQTKQVSQPLPIKISQETVEKKPSIIQPIRTYNADIADAIKGGVSMTKIVSAESDRRARTNLDLNLDSATDSKINAKNVVMIATSLCILVAGIGGVYYIYSKYNQKQAVIVEEAKQLIPSEGTVKLRLNGNSKDSRVTTIRNAIENASVGLGNIEHLQIIAPGSTETSLTTEQFLTALESTASGSLVRSLESDFYLGVHVIHGTQPFLILKVSSFENALAGMLSWESTMIRDLQGIFLPKEAQVVPPFFTVGQTGKTYSFEDAVYQNKDLRLVKNPDGRPIFMYSFVDNATLVITTDDFTLREVTDRLIKSRFVR